ncbi:MAG: hypothetical protein KIT16_02340 [Rhodospirillaceae bacterium]|nr:hypothetical protein [Rhodospirillaceae bacterium]
MLRRTVFAGLGALALSLAAAAPGMAQGYKIATCQIESEGKLAFDGKCRFVPDGGNGSFSISTASGEGALYGEIQIVTVSVISPGVAEVRGLTKDGINSRWGEARRQARDRACWAGSDFRICAR